VNLAVLRNLVYLSLNEQTASHVIAVPLISAVLAYRDRATIFSRIGRGGLPGVVAIAAGIVLMLVGRRTGSLTVASAAIVVLCIGGFLLFLGWRAARSALFPLLFLAFMVPPPDPVTHGVTRFLKAGSVEAVAGLFTVTGTSYYREGAVFALPGFAIEVADECSGIRSSIALLLTALLAGHVLLRGTWTKAILVCLVVPFAVLKNAIRIVVLSLMTLHGDKDFLSGRLHHEGGFVFFAVTLALLLPVVLLLRRWDTTASLRRLA
jgi:exosortase